MPADRASLPTDPHRDAHAREALTEVQMEICHLVAEGHSMTAICSREGMPGRRTVFEWLATKPTFQRAYAMAKALLAEQLAEEIVSIADNGSQDWIDGENGRVLDHEHVQRSRLRVDSRKWLAAKLAPKRYGDASTLRVDQDSDRHNMTPEQVAARLAAIFTAIEKRKG